MQKPMKTKWKRQKTIEKQMEAKENQWNTNRKPTENQWKLKKKLEKTNENQWNPLKTPDKQQKNTMNITEDLTITILSYYYKLFINYHM